MCLTLDIAYSLALKAMVVSLEHLISGAHWKEMMTDPVVGSVILVWMFQKKWVNIEGVNYMRCVFEPTSQSQTQSFNQESLVGDVLNKVVPICLGVWN